MIELTFKQLKPSYALDKIVTKNEQAIKAVILAALLTFVANRRLHNLVRERAPEELRPRYTQLRWAKSFRYGSTFVLELMRSVLGRRPGSADSLDMASRYLTVQALDSHITRHRIHEVWSK